MTILNIMLLLQGLEPTASAITTDWIVSAALILLIIVVGFLAKRFTAEITAKIDNMVAILNTIQNTLAAQAEKNNHFKHEINTLNCKCTEMDTRQARFDRKLTELTRTIDICPSCPSPRKEH